MRVLGLVAATLLVLTGLPPGLFLLGTVQGGELEKVAWALVVGGLCGVLALVDLLVIEPWNFRRAQEKGRYHLQMGVID